MSITVVETVKHYIFALWHRLNLCNICLLWNRFCPERVFPQNGYCSGVFQPRGLISRRLSISSFDGITQKLHRNFVFVSYFFIIFFYKFIFIFFSGQLLVLLSLSVRLTLCCITLTFCSLYYTFWAINDWLIDWLIDWLNLYTVDRDLVDVEVKCAIAKLWIC